jgi:hypothetical protein
MNLFVAHSNRDVTENAWLTLFTESGQMANLQGKSLVVPQEKPESFIHY